MEHLVINIKYQNLPQWAACLPSASHSVTHTHPLGKHFPKCQTQSKVSTQGCYNNELQSTQDPSEDDEPQQGQFGYEAEFS